MSDTNTANYDPDHPNRTALGVQTRPVPTIEWNDNDIKAFTDIGLAAPKHLGQFERKFLSHVDLTKGPIERTVEHLIRLTAPDYLGNTTNKSVPERKEYVYYRERWEGKDWRGIPLNPVDHTIGVYTKKFTRPVVNQSTGEISYMTLDPTKAQTIHYIPFSKKKVDEIIESSAHSDKDTIIYTIKFASEDFPYIQRAPSRCQFSYDQFTNWKFEEACKHTTQPQVDAWVNYYEKKRSGNNLAFEPT